MCIKPTIHIDFDSPEGNIFHIIAVARNAIKSCCIIDAEEKLKEFQEKIEQAKSGDYEHMLSVIREFVEIVEP
jgi:hypothetical protein